MTNPNDYPGKNPDEQPFGGDPQYGAPQYGAPQYGAPQYGAPQYGQPMGMAAGPMPANSMASSIVVTVLGFLFTCGSCISLAAGIIGVVAIVKANSVSSLWSMGNAAAAQAAADDAKKWSNIAWIVFGVSIVLWIVLLIVLFSTGSTVGYYNFN